MLAIFEISNNVRPEIKAIQDVLENIKKRNKYNLLDQNNLVSVLEKTFKCRVHLEFIPDDLNAYVLPYLEAEPKNIKIDKNQPTEISDIIKNVSDIYLWIGIPFLKMFTSGELTAILLHELGHIYIDIHNPVYAIMNAVDNIIIRFLEKVRNIIVLGSFIRHLLDQTHLSAISLSYLYLFIYILKLPCRFCSRKNENLADNYAVKMGYGDELISAFEKLDKEVEKYKSQSFIFKIYYLIVNILQLSTHPKFRDRINKIMDDIEKDYSEEYPHMKKHFDKVFDRYENKILDKK